MAHEIERKFHVFREKLPPLEGGERYVQGYLCEEPQVRFRIIDGRRAVLCVKKFLGPGERLEFEFPRRDLTPEEIVELPGLAIWPPLVKTRYRIPHKGLVWELDVYEGKNEGLITTEVEIPSADYIVSFPDWVDADGEITNDPRYANINLTRKPFRSW